MALSAVVQAQVPPPVLKVEGGGTGANTAAAARANLGAAAAAANSDITSLSGLTTPLPASEGGTGGIGGVSPTGSLSTTPEAVINVADFGGCSGTPASDTANLNAALAAARSSTAYTGNLPVRVIGGYSATGVACAITQANATGFSRFGGGSRLLIEDLALLCSGTGNICLDALGSLNVQFNRVTIIGSAGSPPMIGLQEGNTAPATIACCIHTHYGLEITGSFTFAGLYSAASESTTYYSPIVRNNGANLGVIGTLGADHRRQRLRQRDLQRRSAERLGHRARRDRDDRRIRGRGHERHADQPGQAICDRRHSDRRRLRARRHGIGLPCRRRQYRSVCDGDGRPESLGRLIRVSDRHLARRHLLHLYREQYRRRLAALLRQRLQGRAALDRRRSRACAPLHLYIAQLAAGPCVSLFDNNASFSLHNIGETLEIECESAAATYDVQLTGSNPTPNVSGLTSMTSSAR